MIRNDTELFMVAVQHNPKDIARMVEKNLEIPTIPVVASRALRAMRDESINAPKLAAILQEDPGLTARILKVANSALYALPREIRNLSQAAMIMGFDGLQSLVISAACRGIYKNFGVQERAMWVHAVGVARAAQEIAEAAKVAADEAFVAGLMHDVGRVVMHNTDAARTNESLALAKKEGCEIIEAEQRVFGFTHADVGALLVNRWGLSASLEQAVFLHHDLELVDSLSDSGAHLVHVTALANELLHELDHGPAEQEPSDDAPGLENHAAAQLLGIDATTLEGIRARVKEHLDASKNGG